MNYLHAMLDIVYTPVDWMLENWRNIILYSILMIVIAVIVTLVIIFTRKHK